MSTSEWYTANQAYLVAALDALRGRVESGSGPIADQLGVVADEIAASMSQPPALHRLATSFGLSGFERDLLLMCAGIELDSDFEEVCRKASGRRGATFGLALAALDDAHWSALAPTAALRYWRMVEPGPQENLVNAPLRIDERILHYIGGVSFPDERLLGLAEPWTPSGELPPSHLAIAERIAELWSGPDVDPAAAVRPVQLCGNSMSGLLDVAGAACDQCGLRLSVVRAADLPPGPAERELTVRLVDREAVLDNQAVLLMIDDDDDPHTLRAAAAFVERTRGATVVGGREPLRLPRRHAAGVRRAQAHQP